MVRRLLAVAALLVPLACTTGTMDNGTIFTATTVVAGPSQTPMHDGAIYVTGGIVREVGSAADIRRAHPNARSIHTLDGRLENFADTGAIVDRLDAVVSVDTSVAHLAGALNKPVWVMLPFAADWRWGIAGDRTAWYPSARLVRQRAPGDWDGVVAEVAAALRG